MVIPLTDQFWPIIYNPSSIIHSNLLMLCSLPLSNSSVQLHMNIIIFLCDGVYLHPFFILQQLSGSVSSGGRKSTISQQYLEMLCITDETLWREEGNFILTAVTWWSESQCKQHMNESECDTSVMWSTHLDIYLKVSDFKGRKHIQHVC